MPLQDQILPDSTLDVLIQHVFRCALFKYRYICIFAKKPLTSHGATCKILKKKKSAKPPLCHGVNSPHKYSKIFLNDCRKAILYSVATRPQPRLAHCTNSAPCKIRLYKFFWEFSRVPLWWGGRNKIKSKWHRSAQDTFMPGFLAT